MIDAKTAYRESRKNCPIVDIILAAIEKRITLACSRGETRISMAGEWTFVTRDVARYDCDRIEIVKKKGEDFICRITSITSLERRFVTDALADAGYDQSVKDSLSW